jgi:hypothetical protein
VRMLVLAARLLALGGLRLAVGLRGSQQAALPGSIGTRPRSKQSLEVCPASGLSSTFLACSSVRWTACDVRIAYFAAELPPSDTLQSLDLGWEEWGSHNKRVVLLCPSLSLGSHARSTVEEPTPGWWEGKAAGELP